jgi:hypothetical protein
MLPSVMPRLTVVRLAGGLGNQLFQLMAAVVLAARINQKLSVLVDGLSAYRTQQSYAVSRLILSNNIVDSSALDRYGYIRWLSVRGRVGRWMPYLSVTDRNFRASLIQARRAAHVNYVDGYFQSGWDDELFADALSQVRVCDIVFDKQRSAQYDCLIHIRGGDFLRFVSHAIVGEEFYTRCVGFAREHGCQSFGIVTDDVEYAGFILRELRTCHPSATIDMLPSVSDPLLDFAALRGARHRIIGNSTFAWWAAALDHECRPTWAPDRFVRDTPRDFFLPHEQTIKVFD